MIQFLRLRRISSLSARASAFCCSRSRLIRFFSAMRMYVLMAPTISTTATAAQTLVTISVDGIADPLWLLVLLVLAWTVVALVIFHWVLVPVQAWVVRRLGGAE